MSGEDLDNNGQVGARTRKIGALLEQKRREKGLSLRDVEQATKIRTRYLEGLEREDYGVLPDAIYVQGFLKTYANFLGLDGEQLSRELKDRRTPRRERQPGSSEDKTREFEQPVVIAPGGLGGAERLRISGATILTVLFAVLLLAAVIGVLYLVGSRSAGGPAQEEAADEEALKEDAPGGQSLEPEPSPAPGAAATEQTSPREPVPREKTADTLEVTVRVAGYPTGLTILADGAPVYDGVATPGFSQTFEARDNVTVSTANAGAVSVEVDGQNLGTLGRYGQPLTRTFTGSSQG